MNHEHLTDDQIQEILDTRMLQSGPILPMHLGTCAGCQKRLENFRQLYAELAVDPGFTLPPAFADSIIKKLPASRQFFWQRAGVRILLAISAFVLVLAGLFIFVNMKPMTDAIFGIFNAMTAAFRPLPTQFQQLFAMLNGNAKLFILGGLGLLGAAFFDHILQQQALHRSR